jgi:hypothetical protein
MSGFMARESTPQDEVSVAYLSRTGTALGLVCLGVPGQVFT